MVFSSAIFLFVFLPVVFLLDRLLPDVRAKNVLLLAASLVFYAFGQLVYLPLLLGNNADEALRCPPHLPPELKALKAQRFPVR